MHVNFDVMQDLLFLFSLSCHSSGRLPLSKYSHFSRVLQRPTSLLLPAAGSQAALREADLFLRSAVRKKEQKLQGERGNTGCIGRLVRQEMEGFDGGSSG